MQSGSVVVLHPSASIARMRLSSEMAAAFFRLLSFSSERRRAVYAGEDSAKFNLNQVYLSLTLTLSLIMQQPSLVLDVQRLHLHLEPIRTCRHLGRRSRSAPKVSFTTVP